MSETNNWATRGVRGDA